MIFIYKYIKFISGHNIQETTQQQQWQPISSGISENFGGGGDIHSDYNAGGHGLESGGNSEDLASHGGASGGQEVGIEQGIGLEGNGFGENDHIDLKPRVEVQHDVIPTKTVERTQEVPVNIVKKIKVPVPHPVGVPTPQLIKIPIPQPYAIHVPFPQPIKVPIYKLVPQEIEKKVPITVEKLIPIYIDKPVQIEIEKHHIEYVEKPYPVHVPVYKHIFNHTPRHHHR